MTILEHFEPNSLDIIVMMTIISWMSSHALDQPDDKVEIVHTMPLASD